MTGYRRAVLPFLIIGGIWRLIVWIYRLIVHRRQPP